MKINNFGQKIEKFVMLTFEFLHFETLFFLELKMKRLNSKTPTSISCFFQLLRILMFGTGQPVLHRPAGRRYSPMLLSSRVLLLSRDLLCTGCCTINGLGIAWCQISVKLKNSIFMAIFWYLNLWMIRNKLDVQS